jgi:hypothetical protein
MIGMNLIAVKNNTIFTLYLDSEECGSERLASYGELHGDDISSLHRVAAPAPHVVKHQVGLYEPVFLPSKLLGHGI